MDLDGRDKQVSCACDGMSGADAHQVSVVLPNPCSVERGSVGLVVVQVDLY